MATMIPMVGRERANNPKLSQKTMMANNQNLDWMDALKSGQRVSVETPKTRASGTPMSSSFGASSQGSFDDLGDGGLFEKMFDSIPECKRNNVACNFYDTQQDWSQADVPVVFREKPKVFQNDEMEIDWSKNGYVMYKPDFWEYQMDWTNLGVPVTKQMYPEMIFDWSETGIPNAMKEMTEKKPIQLDWSTPGIPHIFNVGSRRIPEQEPELMVNWSKRGVPRKNSYWDSMPVDWSGPNLPDVWETATTKEIKFMSFMPGPYNWNKESFWDYPVIDWSCKKMPRLFRKVCEKPSYTWKETPVDWTVRGLPIAFRKLKGREEQPMMDWSKPGVPIATDWMADPIMDWSAAGVPKCFNVYKRSPPGGEFICDWSVPGIPKEFATRAYASDDDLIINWTTKGIPKQFKGTGWDGIYLDWTCNGIPKSMRPKTERFNYVYAKRLSDFFMPPSRDNLTNQEELLNIDWTQLGIPHQFAKKQRFDRGEELMLDWSYKSPPSPFRYCKWYDLKMDWSVHGIPLKLRPKESKWDPLVMSWHESGLPQQFRMIMNEPDKFWDNPSLQWNEASIPNIFEVQSHEWLFPLDWTEPGIPKQFKWMAKRERELHLVDWCSPGLPVQFKFWNQSFVDWSVTGMPSIFAPKSRPKNLMKPLGEELMVNWSKKRLPQVENGSRWDHPAIDWGGDRLPGTKDYFHAIKFKQRPEICVDWSRKGLPDILCTPKAQMYEKEYGKIIDWTENGVPFKDGNLDYMIFDWSQTGVPHAFKQGQYEEFQPIDWTQKGIPKEMQETWWDCPMINWRAKGIPKVFNVKCTVARGRLSTCTSFVILAPNANQRQRFPDYCFDWSREGLPVHFGFWEEPMWDWSCRGLPAQSGRPDLRIIDWAHDGVPFPDSFDFGPDSLRVAKSPTDIKRCISAQQEELCLVESDLRIMKEVHIDTHKRDIFNPWNRLTDNRREAAFLKGARATKKTKRVWRYLRIIKSKFCAEADRKLKDFKLTRKRKNQRVDKRRRRGDTPYAGQEFIDEDPTTHSSFWKDWPDLSKIADNDEIERTQIVQKRRISRQTTQELKRKSQQITQDINLKELNLKPLFKRK